MDLCINNLITYKLQVDPCPDTHRDIHPGAAGILSATDHPPDNQLSHSSRIYHDLDKDRCCCVD